MRFALGLVATLGAYGTAQNLAIAQVEYEVVIIEPWDQNYALATSRVAGINNHNVASGCASPLSGGCSFLWTRDGGKVQVSLAGPINNEGYMAGGSYLRTPDDQLIEMAGLGTAADLNDAQVVVGYLTGRYWGGCRYTRDARVWDAVNGTRSLFADFGVTAAHEARAINNANEVVGVRSNTGSCGDFEAFYLNLDTGEHIDIHAELVGGSMGITEAHDINDAGVVVGEGPFNNVVTAFTWSRADGFTFLPVLPGTVPSYSIPSSINLDGVVVGQAIVGDEWRAWVWDELRGIRDLNEIADGIPDEFVIEEAKQINENGWIIARGHYGVWSPERAVVLIPVNGACVADFDEDGNVNSSDVLEFLNAWNAQQPAGDFDNNGLFNSQDVLAFLNAWNAGC